MIRAKVRFDFKGTSKPGRLFFGGKEAEKVAEENRDLQLASFKNIPIQGIWIDDIDISGETYTLIDSGRDDEIAYSPLELLVSADSIEDLAEFIMREEFRKIDILEPDELLLSSKEIGKLLYRMNDELKTVVTSIARRYEGR